jgi:hypothetical protein
VEVCRQRRAMSKADEADNADRQATKVTLLEAMYPSEFKWDPNSTVEVSNS